MRPSQSSIALISGLLTNSCGLAWIGGNTTGATESGRIRRSWSRAAVSAYECEIKHFAGKGIFIDRPQCDAPIAGDLELNWMAGSLTDGKSKRQKPTRLWNSNRRFAQSKRNRKLLAARSSA